MAALLAVDAGSAALACLVAYSSVVDWWLVATITAGWVAAIGMHRAYEYKRPGIGADELRRVVRSAVILTGIAACVSWWIFRSDRLLHDVVDIMPVAALLTIGSRYALRLKWRMESAKASRHQRVLVVGHANGVIELADALRRRSAAAVQVAGCCLPERDMSGDTLVPTPPILGDFRDVADAAAGARCDVVVVLPGPEWDGVALRRLGWQLQAIGVELMLAPIVADVAPGRMVVRPAAGLPLLQVRPPTLSTLPRIPKELADRLFALLGLVLLLPVLLAIAVGIRVTSPGPALFKQKRVGRGGREFTVLKFRTMYQDAEARKAELAHLNQTGGPLFKMHDDPRITKIGRILRRYSLDELPQLCNVISGSMSLVGPRPPLPAEVAAYSEDMRRRLLVKPGLTGLWQVSGRSDLPWDEAVRLDLGYVENWSFGLDVEILLKTTSAVVRGTGAY